MTMIFSMTRKTPQPFQLLPIHGIMHSNDTASHKALLCLCLSGCTLLCFQLLLNIFKMHVDYVENTENLCQVVEAG